MQLGCIFVCSVCHQRNFEDTVLPVQNLQQSIHNNLPRECLTGYSSINDMEYMSSL